VLLASLDFEYGAVVGMHNFDGEVKGLPYGYASSDLSFTASVDNSGPVSVITWSISGSYFCTLASTTVSHRRRRLTDLTGELGGASGDTKEGRRRRLPGVGDSSAVGVTIEVGLCNTHQFQWLGTCYDCAPTSCAAGQYLAACDGLTYFDSSECLACTTSTACAAGEFLFGTCDGTTTIDVQQCKPCAQCVAGSMLDSQGKPCEETCDADPVYDNCPAEVGGWVSGGAAVLLLHNKSSPNCLVQYHGTRVPHLWYGTTGT
jgi:hypothetical protein